ncbi:MAG: signal peptide peptidase SppA [Firmicutes bacterium]|nr:signal peptide peptidase SppA [Bacillota bacterium]
MKAFFQSCLGTFVALILFVGLGVMGLIGLGAAMGASAAPKVPSKAVLIFDLSQPIPDSAQDVAPGQALQRALQGGSDGTPLPVLLNALERASQDSSISALFLTGNVRGGGYASGPAALKELRGAIQRFKEVSGKPVIAYNLGYAKPDLYLCAGASSLAVHPMGGLDLTGYASEPMFYAGAFKKYGIEMQITRVGKYKSAVEPFFLEKMSDANREQTQAFLGDIWEDWKAVVAGDRKLDTEAIQKLADEKGEVLSEEALRAKLVDRIATYDEVLDELKKVSGKEAKDKDFPQIDMGTYAKIPGKEAKGKNRIAVVYAEGEIVDGDGQGGQIGGDSLSRELRRLRLDKNVKAIVLRVNSPGGSAVASELIQREVILCKAAGKPVVVSMGYVAASGGYWISTYADRIFAQPNTITGSIGVFGTLPNIKKLANEHGITWDSVQTSKLAAPSLARPRTPEELARIQFLVDDIYDRFLTKVSEGRHLPKEKVGEIAQGRVWSGKAALKLGLVDEMGGLQSAIQHAAKLAKIENDYRVDAPEAPKDPIEKLMNALGKGEKRRLVKAGPVDDLKAQFERTWDRLQAMNDPRGVYARMPFDLEIK